MSALIVTFLYFGILMDTMFIMKTIRTTEQFNTWFSKLKDKQTKARINVRLRRLELGHYGDCKAVGNDVRELRFFFGSGYRIYYTERNGEVVILLCAGDKSSQTTDIKKAKAISDGLED